MGFEFLSSTMNPHQISLLFQALAYFQCNHLEGNVWWFWGFCTSVAFLLLSWGRRVNVNSFETGTTSPLTTGNTTCLWFQDSWFNSWFSRMAHGSSVVSAQSIQDPSGCYVCKGSGVGVAGRSLDSRWMMVLVPLAFTGFNCRLFFFPSETQHGNEFWSRRLTEQGPSDFSWLWRTIWVQSYVQLNAELVQVPRQGSSCSEEDSESEAPWLRPWFSWMFCSWKFHWRTGTCTVEEVQSCAQLNGSYVQLNGALALKLIDPGPVFSWIGYGYWCGGSGWGVTTSPASLAGRAAEVLRGVDQKTPRTVLTCKSTTRNIVYLPLLTRDTRQKKVRKRFSHQVWCVAHRPTMRISFPQEKQANEHGRSPEPMLWHLPAMILVRKPLYRNKNLILLHVASKKEHFHEPLYWNWPTQTHHVEKPGTLTLEGSLRGAWDLNASRDWNWAASRPGRRRASGTEAHPASGPGVHLK